MKTITGLCLSLLLAAGTALSQPLPGTLDLSFDAGSAITKPVHSSVLLADGSIVIVGDFHSVNGVAAAGIARLLPDGTTDTVFTTNALRWNIPGQTITNVLEWGMWPYCAAVAVQSDGKILVGGDFWNPDWGTPTGLIRLNPDGSWDDTFPLPVRAYAQALAIQKDGKILVGGGFTVSGRNCIVRLNPDGSVDETFLYNLPGANSTVLSVVLQADNKILIGGYFNQVNNSLRNGVARLNPDGSLDETFVASVDQRIRVNTIVVQPDGKVLIGGDFTGLNGASRNRLARLNADGSLDPSFLSGMSGADAQVYALSLQSDGKILAGGDFTSFNGSSQPHLVRLATTGSVDTSFSSGTGGLDAAVYSITRQADGRLLVGGAFSTVGGVVQSKFARLGTSGSLDTTFTNGPAIFSGSISCLALQTDGKILANSVARTGIGRFLANGAPDATFLNNLSGANGPVNAITVMANGLILVAGEFSQFDGVASRAIVRLQSTGAIDNSFRNGIGGTSGTINVIKQQRDGKILIGGSFDQIKGVARRNIARLNADGSLDTTFLASDSGVNGEVFSLAIQPDDLILVGGEFTDVNGAARNNIARLKPDGSLDRTFQEGMAGPDGPVYTLTMQDTNVLVGGFFWQLNGTTCPDLARLFCTNGSLDTNFSLYWVADESFGIRAVTLQADGRILIAGDIWLAGGHTVNYITRVQPNGRGEGFLIRPLGADAPVTALQLLDNSRILVGGSFGTFNSTPRSYLACLVYDAPSVSLGLALGDSNLTWTNNGTLPWFGQTGIAHDGVAAAQSGAITHDQSSILSTTITGPGCLSFWWKVSSEEGYDFLSFSCTGPWYTNGFSISGEVDWQQHTFCIPDGVFELTWTYSKDWVFSWGLDAAWVDEVKFTPGDLAPLITLNPINATNTAGDSVVFSAGGIGPEPLSYQWFFNGFEIPDATNSYCVVDSLVPEQAGIYSLRISNAYGASFSTGAQLVVMPLRGLGANDYGQANISMLTLDAKAVAAGQYHSMILKSDGSIYAWGNNSSGQCAIPPSVGRAMGIAAGGYHSLAIKPDNTVAGWGDNTYGQAAPPAGLSNVLAVSAGTWHSLALTENGTVVGWGDNSFGQATPPPTLSNIVAIAAGGSHSLALAADGRVFGWGGNIGLTGTYAGQATVPWGLNHVVCIAAGGFHSLAVKSDGTIVGWGDNSQGQLDTPTNLPPAVSVVGGGMHTVAVLADGTAAAWGENYDGRCDISRTLTNVAAAAAGQVHTLLLFGQRPPPPEIRALAWSGGRFSVQVPTYSGKLYALEYKDSMVATNWTLLPGILGTGRLLTLTDPAAIGPHRYYRVRQW